MPNFARLLRRHSVAVPCVKHLGEINKNSKYVTPLSKDDLMDKFYHQMNSTEGDCRKSHELDKLIPSNNEGKLISEQAKEEGYLQNIHATSEDNKEIQEIIALVEEINNIASRLKRDREFEVILIPAEYKKALNGDKRQQNKVMVQMTDTTNGNRWLWPKEKFWIRRLQIQDLYQRIQDGDITLADSDDDVDPFFEEPTDELIGTALLSPHFLAYGLDTEEDLKLYDFKGTSVGEIKLKITPCNDLGQDTFDLFVEDPVDLIGRQYSVKVLVQSATVYSRQFSQGLKVKYKMYGDDRMTETDTVTGTFVPVFNHVQTWTFHAITEEHIEYFKNGDLAFHLYGLQKDPSVTQTRRADDVQSLQKVSFSSDSGEVGQLKAEILVLEHRIDRLLQKEQAIQDLCLKWENNSEDGTCEQLNKSLCTIAFSHGNKHKAFEKILEASLMNNVEESNPSYHQLQMNNCVTTECKTDHRSKICVIL